MDAKAWTGLIERRNTWINHNFPGPDMPNTMLGVMEELGELTHGWLKRDQRIRGTAEQHNEDMKDAVGDMTVYLLGFMRHYKEIPVGGSTDPIFPELDIVEQPHILRQMAWRVGLLATERDIRESLNHLIYLLRLFCWTEDWDYGTIVNDTWNAVEQRDWIKYPDTGFPPKPLPEEDCVLCGVSINQLNPDCVSKYHQAAS